MAKRNRKPNYALKGDIDLEFWAENDQMALSKAQNAVVDGPIGLTKLFRLGRMVDEVIFAFEKSDSVLCHTMRVG